jgi:hypothetical protein
LRCLSLLKSPDLLKKFLVRQGKLTAAALESSLSVGGAERMPQAPSAEHHLEVTVEHGRLV